MLKVSVIFLTVLGVNSSYAQKSACSISFPKQSDKEEPVLLTLDDENGYQLAIPEKGKFILKANEALVLFCPNTRNALAQANENVATASCVRNEILRVSNQQYEFDEFNCLKAVKGDVQTSSTRCGNNKGKIIDIGFHVTKSNWITLIQVCYDSQHGTTLYTEHTIYGQSILQASKQSSRPAFQATEVTKGLSPNSVYTQASQTVAFISLLGKQSLANRYIHQNSYLARGHLSPDADFLFAPLQFATYFYINTCPQWSIINSGNWKSLESMIRKVTGKYGEPFKVITGTHEILELPDEDGHLRSMALDARGLLPVPKFIWKILYSETSKQGIAFISINNPYIDRITDDEMLCQDVCSRYNWVADKWHMPEKGFIYCCDIRELQKVVPTIPKLSVGSILRA